jgi:energy-coupling factor transporter ATP-binding protein EcfA2
LTGANGSGKTTLLNVIGGRLTPASGIVRVKVPTRILPQRLDCLDNRISVLASIQQSAPGATQAEIRSSLARFGFRGRAAEAPAETLSGGERFRATLAAILLARPAPQLLILDEPTNSLDVASVEQLVSAVCADPIDAVVGRFITRPPGCPLCLGRGRLGWVSVMESGGWCGGLRRNCSCGAGDTVLGCPVRTGAGWVRA